jgi:TonB-linked SusC/RagA family outer membrane protein
MNWRDIYRACGAVGVGLVTVLVMALPTHAQETGTIEGTLTDATTQRPLAGALVQIPETGNQAVTTSAGRYSMDVPAGQHTVEARLLGYEEQEQTVTVQAGEVSTLNFRMLPAAIALREVVVTGVAEATPRAKLPFTVDQLRAENLPVPAASAASAIQGKIAGAQVVQGSGRPGSPPSILLRGPTSINASGRDQEPMYIVDGVILGASMVDIDAIDIEDIEVVKGAAASSLYGSRAANGVINITTRRGTGLEDDQIRYSIRSEYGMSELEGRFNLAQRHGFAMTEGQDQFLTGAGDPCAWLQCPNVGLAGQMARPGESPNSWNTIQNNPWPQTFDHVDRFFDAGNWLQNHISAEGRSGRTNFHISMQNLREEGVLPGQSGRDRTNFRLNLDQEVRDDVLVSASAFYSTSDSDLIPESQGNPIFNLTRMPAGVDLAAADPDDPDGRVILNPDPFNIDNTNPLNDMLYREWGEQRNRFLGSANVRFSPAYFLSLDANISYDRLNEELDTRVPRGFRTGRPTATLNDGWVSRENIMEDALNTSLTATVRQTFGELATRAQFRYLLERNDLEWSGVSGYRFAADEVYTIGNTDPETRTGSSGVQREIAEGLFATVNLDFRDRYIVDAMVRRDGSSLFGPDERENWYYRVAGAYLISQEDFFDVQGIDLLKVSYSMGTAGTRPHWAAQYETYSVEAGVIQPISLGNRALRPEFSREHEVGLEVDAFERYNFALTYADVTTEDQILPVPAPAYGGFAHQWQNAGTLASNTWEASLNALLVSTPSLSWSARVQLDRTRQRITEMAVPPFTYGVGGQGLGNVFQAREGERLGTFYGIQFAESCADLPTGFDAAPCEAFQVNDEGFLVWVGDAESWRDGWEDRGDGRNHWGTLAPFTIEGNPVYWGTPFAGWRPDPATGEETNFMPLGNTLPDWSMGVSSTVNFAGFSVYGLIDAVQGVDIYNQPLQWAVFQRYGGVVDQDPNAPMGDQKPLGYYDFLYGTSGLMPSSRFVEDGSFVKLREVSLSYTIGQDRLGTVGLGALSGATLSLVGRNLFTWTDYDGYDPEVGRMGGETGSAALARVDGFNYPNFRTFTLGVQLNF